MVDLTLHVHGKQSVTELAAVLSDLLFGERRFEERLDGHHGIEKVVGLVAAVLGEEHIGVPGSRGPDGEHPTADSQFVALQVEIAAPEPYGGGLLSLVEACSRYTLTVEEFLAWQSSIDRHGLAGLRATRIQQYRQ